MANFTMDNANLWQEETAYVITSEFFITEYNCLDNIKECRIGLCDN